MAATAYSAQGSKLYIGTGTGSAVVPSAITVGNPTILTSAAHGQTNGTAVTLAGFTGADAATLNGQVAIIQFKTTNTFAVAIDTSGKTITVSGSPTATPVTYTQVKNLKQYSGLDGAASDLDATNLDSTAKEWIPGIIDNGQFTVTVDDDPADAGQVAVLAKQGVAGTLFKIVLPSAASLPNVAFTGYIKKFSMTGGVDKILERGIDVKITGAVTRT